MKTLTLEDAARVCHEVNRAYCASIGDLSQVPWEQAPDWQQDSAKKGVLLHLAGDHPPSVSHEAWAAHKLADGWTFGEVKDEAAKTHPCLVPFDDLPVEQQIKDVLFTQTVVALRPIIDAKEGNLATGGQ